MVAEDGTTLDVGGVTVDFPAGSATGAEVSAASLAAARVPTEVDVSQEAYADSSPSSSDSEDGASVAVVPLADGISVELDDGQTQPSSPVRVTFPLPTGASPGADLAAGNVALVVESTDGTVELVPASFDEVTGTVSGEVAHFSGIWPVSLDIDAMVETVLLAVGATSPKPPCADQPATIGEERYTVYSDPLMWMCLARTGDGAGLVVGATANASFPFLAEPDVVPDAGVSTPEGTAAGVASAWASDVFGLVPEGKVAVFPSGQTDVTYAQAPGDVLIGFEPAPQLLLVSILAEVGSVAFSMSPAELAETFGQLECMGGVGELIGQAADGALTPAVGSELLGAFFSCAGTVAELTPAQEVVVALFSAAPQLLIGGLWGTVTTVAGASTFTVSVRVSGGGDPISAEALEPFLGTWSGPVDQPGSRAYGIEVTISATPDGFAAARVRYPELDNCTGYWDDTRLRGATLRMVEHIEAPAGSCVDEVDVVLRRVGDQLSYKSVWSGSVAKGLLSRGPYEGGTDGGETTAAWPTGRSEGPPALMVWLGANMYDFPAWVSCDDDQDWCLVGGSAEHVLVQMDGLVDRGTVADSTADPVAALVALGAPRPAVTQILD